MTELSKIGFGGGCHWCTEAVFASLKGVHQVDQGWISSVPPNESFSEAVVVYFDETIDLKSLITIHLHTHKSTSDHSLRNKYRSAVYFFDKSHESIIEQVLIDAQKNFDEGIITQALPFSEFKMSELHYQNYYYSQPGKPFCTSYITPKLTKLLNLFKEQADVRKIENSI